MSPVLGKRIDLAKRRVAYLERLAEAKRDVAIGNFSAPIKKAKDLLK